VAAEFMVTAYARYDDDREGKHYARTRSAVCAFVLRRVALFTVLGCRHIFAMVFLLRLLRMSPESFIQLHAGRSETGCAEKQR
jgi:hypothetical protein